MKSPSGLSRFFRGILVVLGAMSAGLAVVNIIATIRLIEPAEEAELGLSRNGLVTWYALQLVAGLAMLFFGLRRRK